MNTDIQKKLIGVSLFAGVLQVLSMVLYARSLTDSPSDVSSDLLDAVATKPLEDAVDSAETDDKELLNGIDDEDIREAFRVCGSVV